MSLLFWGVFLMAFLGAQWKGKGYHEDYISADGIQPIKGIFIALVFISHFVQYVMPQGIWDQPYYQVRTYLGQLVVAPFLFYSGYGILESIQKKGISYVKRMPLHRIGVTLFRFSAAVLLYLAVQLALGNRYSIKTVLLSLVGWESLGNSNWYIFCILCLYAATWLAFFVIRKGTLLPLIVVTMLTVGYILLMQRMEMPSWWYNTAAVYAAGMWFSYLRKYLEKVYFAHWSLYLAVLAVAVAAFLVLKQRRNTLLWYELHGVFFAFAIVLLTCKLKIVSPPLHWCGKHLFSVFVLQRIPMIVLDGTVLEAYPLAFFAVCLGITIGFAWLFDFAMDKLWKLLVRKDLFPT